METAPKTVIKANGKVKKPVKSLKSFKDIDGALEQGVALFEELSERLSDKAERATKVIEEIRQLCAEQNISAPELENIIKESNKLTIYSTKLDRYLKEIKDEKASTEKRVAVMGVMVELGSQIEKVDVDTPKTGE